MGIPEVCLIDTDAGAIILELTTTEAGAQITGGSGTGYAQVSSIVSSAETRTITASITGVPSGTSLTVATSLSLNANDGGVLGTGSSATALVNAAGAVTLVTGIGSCYTGTAADDGYVFDYVWDAATGDYGSIVATGGTTATVVLTITDS
ncbi:MAG: hypothetical protein QM487_04435 [Candidatus Marithrix sp.]